MRKTNRFKKPLCAALAVVLASGCVTVPVSAKGTGNLESKFNKLAEGELHSAGLDKAERSIAEMVDSMSKDAGFKSFGIGKAVSAYNVDTKATFYLYPVFCDGALKYVAEADSQGGAIVTTNTKTYKALVSLDKNNSYIVYVDNGTYFASDAEETVELYSENYEIKDEGINFDGKSFTEKENIIKKNTTSEYTEYKPASIKSIKPTEYTTTTNDVSVGDASAKGWFDWWYKPDNGETVTKKCGIKKFLLQGNYGLCWACTVGTIVDYKLNKNLEGKDVADLMGIGYNTGATTDEIRVALGKYGLSYKTYNNKLSFAQIKSNIDADKPFAICLATNNAGHAITGYGYSYNTANTSASASTNLVYAWDSNGFQISFAQNARTINTSGYRFQWYNAVY